MSPKISREDSGNVYESSAQRRRLDSPTRSSQRRRLSIFASPSTHSPTSLLEVPASSRRITSGITYNLSRNEIDSLLLGERDALQRYYQNENFNRFRISESVLDQMPITTPTRIWPRITTPESQSLARFNISSMGGVGRFYKHFEKQSERIKDFIERQIGARFRSVDDLRHFYDADNLKIIIQAMSE